MLLKYGHLVVRKYTQKHTFLKKCLIGLEQRVKVAVEEGKAAVFEYIATTMVSQMKRISTIHLNEIYSHRGYAVCCVDTCTIIIWQTVLGYIITCTCQ